MLQWAKEREHISDSAGTEEAPVGFYPVTNSTTASFKKKLHWENASLH